MTSPVPVPESDTIGSAIEQPLAAEGDQDGAGERKCGRWVNDYNQDIVSLLRPLRRLHGLTSGELASRIDCAASSVTQRETGARILDFPDGITTLREMGVGLVMVPLPGTPPAVLDSLVELLVNHSAES